MPESNMKVRDVHSHLKKAGWSLARSKGGHDVFKHPKAKHSIPVPRHALKAPLVRGIMKASKVEEQLEKKGRFVSGPVKQPFKSNTVVTSVKEAAPQDEHFAKQSQKMRDAINTHLRRGHSYENAVKLAKRHVKEEVGQMDEKKNLPGLWANIHARREKGLPRKKPGEKGYPKTLNIESAQDPTEGEMKGKQGYSRKAQIVMNAAKGKKSDNQIGRAHV